MERKNFSAIIKRLLSPHLYYSNFSTTRFRIAISRWGSRGQLDNWKMLDRGKIFISLGWISLGLSNALRFVNASREIPFNSLVKIFQLWAISFGNRNIVSREGRMREREREETKKGKTVLIVVCRINFSRRSLTSPQGSRGRDRWRRMQTKGMNFKGCWNMNCIAKIRDDKSDPWLLNTSMHFSFFFILISVDKSYRFTWQLDLVTFLFQFISSWILIFRVLLKFTRIVDQKMIIGDKICVGSPLLMNY